ncbi:hypothetical protein BaRGS_00030980 [Batillaria attramentaria]|uniref:Ankyrin repeat protein n=1 Tax=Batillaria attramentaria TaxID=370345 RepID=A0ABD0JT98_9CAEN
MSDKQLSSKLRRAINSGDFKTVQRLVKGGVDVNASYDSTLLHEAVSMSSAELVEMLIRAGADANRTNQDGRTALHLACRGGHVDIVRSLIAAGTNDGKTCLHVGSLGADMKMWFDCWSSLMQTSTSLISEGCTALYWAARSSYLPILKMLVASGAKVNYRVKSKWTPLHMALHLGHMTVVKYLILQGAETNIVVENKTVVSLLMGNEHLSPQVVRDTLDMFVRAGYNLNKDTWSPPPVAASSKTGSCNRTSDIDRGFAEFSKQSVLKWLESRRTEVPCLVALCRTRIRKRLSYCNKGRSIIPVLPNCQCPHCLLITWDFKAMLC